MSSQNDIESVENTMVLILAAEATVMEEMVGRCAGERGEKKACFPHSPLATSPHSAALQPSWSVLLAESTAMLGHAAIVDGCCGGCSGGCKLVLKV